MDFLVDNLFLFSKMDTNHYPFHFQKTEVNGYLKEYFDQARDEFLPKGLEVSFESDCSDEIFIKLDRDEMSRVLSNILENSLKYKTAEVGKIKAELKKNEDNLVLTLTDDGPGVEDEELSKLFKRFYRTDPSRANTHDGSGLGLAIAKHIIGAHRGTIIARDNLGLEIEITLPIERRSRYEADLDY